MKILVRRALYWLARIDSPGVLYRRRAGWELDRCICQLEESAAKLGRPTKDRKVEPELLARVKTARLHLTQLTTGENAKNDLWQSLKYLEGRVWRIGYPKGRSRKATPEVVNKVKRWKGSKAEIARRLGISRQTVY